MRYAVARYNEKQRDTAYRVYVTDCLRMLAGADERYADWINPKTQNEDKRSGEEIAADVLKRAGIEVI